jgi:hypothetical protein
VVPGRRSEDFGLAMLFRPGKKLDKNLLTSEINKIMEISKIILDKLNIEKTMKQNQ